MKVAKEQIVGMVAAVDWLLEQSDEANQAEYMRVALTRLSKWLKMFPR